MRGFNLDNELKTRETDNSSFIIMTSSSLLTCAFYIVEQESLGRSPLGYRREPWFRKENIRILTPQEDESYLENKTLRANNSG